MPLIDTHGDFALDPLVIDIYEPDLGKHPDFPKLAAAGYPWCGAIIKISQGLQYAPEEWVKINWPAIRAAGGDRYGVDWLRGGYCYWMAGVDNKKQAQLYNRLIELGGGWDKGDLWPIIDAETAGNTHATKAQVEDGISEYAEEILRLVGIRPMLYGGTLMYDLGIVSHMGCEELWFPRYTADLPPNTFERIGWTLPPRPAKRPTVWGWQYDGDGESYLKGYPKVCPIGTTDITAIIVNGGGLAGINWTLANTWPENPRG